MEHRGPLVIFANFASEVSIDLRAHEVLSRWTAQAPRKIWLARPGDVLVTPVRLSPAFRRYAGDLLGVPAVAVDVVTVPPWPDASLAEAVRRAGLLDTLRELAGQAPRARLLPISLDEPSVALAAELGIGVFPYRGGVVSPEALEVTSRLNTKAGFRRVASHLGIRLPPGRVCRGAELAGTVSDVLRAHERVVVKPDRSAGGYGVRLISRADGGAGQRLGPTTVGGTEEWVVEEHVDAVRAISVQLESAPEGPRVRFSGEMRMSGVSFSFDGYSSPLRGVPETTVRELERWGLALGRYLAGHGYAGPYGLDAVLDRHGTLFATESNIRRTATTTPYAMVSRLAEAARLPSPAWLIGTRRSTAALGFAGAVELLRAERLDWDPHRGEGVVLYADAPPDGVSWQYAVIGPNRARLAKLEAGLAEVLPRSAFWPRRPR